MIESILTQLVAIYGEMTLPLLVVTVVLIIIGLSNRRGRKL